jgi:hypothetical protein
MKKILNLQKELKGEELRPFPIGTGAFLFTTSTPAHEFNSVIVPIHGGNWFLELGSRDWFDEGLAKDFLSWALTNEESLDPVCPIQLIRGFSSPLTDFENIVALNRRAHGLFQAQSSELHERTLVIFPAYECEFNGRESISEIDIIRHDIVPTLDWKRKKSETINCRKSLLSKTSLFPRVPLWVSMFRKRTRIFHPQPQKRNADEHNQTANDELAFSFYHRGFKSATRLISLP